VPFRGLRIFLLLSWVLIVILGLLARDHLVPRPAVGLSQLLLVFPSARSFSDLLGSPPRRDAYAQDGSVLGSVIDSRDLSHRAAGYSGEISLLVGISQNGTISGVKVLDHSETPSYVRNLEEWLNTFRGRSVKEPLRIGEDLDGMTNATVTSKGIANGVRFSARAVARKVYRIETPADIPERLSREELLKGGIAFSLFLMAIIGVIRGKRRLRWLTLGLGLVLVGFVYNFQLSVVNLSAIISLKPSLSLSVWILFGLSVLTAPILGRVYCNWICPFGAVQEVTYRILPKRAESPPAHRDIEILRYVILWEITLAVVLTSNLMYADYEPFMTLFARKGTLLLWFFLVVVLFFSFFRYRFWCRYFCALGAFYHLLSRFTLVGKREKGGANDREGDTEGA
jgi:NosR/NirI family nitrous oxide reductase transcriptional regulator